MGPWAVAPHESRVCLVVAVEACRKRVSGCRLRRGGYDALFRPATRAQGSTRRHPLPWRRAKNWGHVHGNPHDRLEQRYKRIVHGGLVCLPEIPTWPSSSSSCVPFFSNLKRSNPVQMSSNNTTCTWACGCQGGPAQPPSQAGLAPQNQWGGVLEGLSLGQGQGAIQGKGTLMDFDILPGTTVQITVLYVDIDFPGRLSHPHSGSSPAPPA